MKPLHLKKNTQSHSSSFFSLKTNVPHLYDKWHYHQELEILYVIDGKGTRFIGDCVQDFDNGDLVLVGPNLPHVWKNDSIFYEDKSINASVILIHFLREVINQEFLSLPEMKPLQILLDQSSQGIKIDRKGTSNIAPLLERVVESNGPKRIILLLSILEEMANSNYELLSSHWFGKSYSEPKNDRITKVYDYILAHFNEQITLDELAEIANMNKTALCRFFKSTTQKTTTEFINEIRIGYAFNLINTKDYSVTRACFESGFNSLSYFNRQFNKIMGYSPSALKKSFRNE